MTRTCAARINRVWPDEELLRFAMDHPVGRRAADAFGPDDLLQGGRDLVEFVVEPSGECGA
jgi:hypothetical protein